MVPPDKSDKYEDEDLDRDDDDAEESPSDPGHEDDDEEEEEEEEEEPAKAASSSTSKKKKKPQTASKKSAARARRAVGGRNRRAKPAASPARNIILYGVLIGGIAILFFALGGLERSSKPERPSAKWDVGQTVELPVTLVTPDVDDLACASDEKVKGLYCGYQSNGKPAKEKERNARTASKMLQPYTTTDGRNFLAAGLWTNPFLKQKLAGENPNNPSPRFTILCKFKVEGKVGDLKVRWKPPPEGGWQGVKDWHAGTISGCRLKSPNRKKLPARPIKPRRIDKPGKGKAPDKAPPKSTGEAEKPAKEPPKDKGAADKKP